MRASYGTVLLVVLLAGCTLGPNYFRPAVEVPPVYRFEPQETAVVAGGEWLKQFGDPVLEALVGEALAHNWDVKLAAANVEAAAAVIKQTRAALYPQVGYGFDAGRDRVTELGANRLPAHTVNPQTAYQLLANASWEIDLWGRVRRLTESAQANMMAAEEVRRGVILSLVATVASNYILLRGLDEQLDIAHRTLEAYAEALRLFELQFKYGQVPQMTVAQAESQYQTAAEQIPLIEQQIGQAESALSFLLGRNPGPIERGKSIFALGAPAVPADLPSELLERRPDIMQAEQQLISANAQIGAAKALYFPTISLTAAAGWGSEELLDLFKGPAGVWSFVGAITGPIFTAGAIKGEIEEAEAVQQAALFNYQQSIQNAFADVSSALIARQKLTEQNAAQDKLVQSLRDYSRLARLQYDGGYAPYSTVLQADQQLFPSELNWAATRAAALSSLVRIYETMGGAWIDEMAKLSNTDGGMATSTVAAP